MSLIVGLGSELYGNAGSGMGYAYPGEKIDLTTFTTEPFVGAYAADWISPSAAELSDNFYANLLTVGAAEYSRYLQAVGFANARRVPPDATITGIEVLIEKREAAGTGTKDNVISLVKDGVIQGDNKADTVTEWPITDAIFTYGGSSDLWGLALTPADVNAPDFGAVLSFIGGAVAGQGFVDHIQMAVYFS